METEDAPGAPLTVAGIADNRHVPLDLLASDGMEAAAAALRRILPAVDDAGRVPVCRFGSSI